MKRILSISIACILLLFCFTLNTFAASAKNLQYEVSVGGENEVVVQAGDEITVDLYLNNITDGGTYTITNLQNEIQYDSEFFEVTKEDVELVEGKATSATLATYSLGSTRVRILGNTVKNGAATEFENKQLLAKVTFTVKEGLSKGSSSELVNKVLIAADALSDVEYTISTQNMTVYIGEKPAQTYTITYKDGNDVVHTENKVGSAKIHTALSAANKKFAGWKDTSGKIWNAGETYTVTKDMTFTAVWVERYTLSFNTNGGTSVASKEAWEDETISLSQFTTTKTGYTFGGWYKDSGLTQKITSIKLTEDTTVYAKWTSSGGGGATPPAGGGTTPVTPPADDEQDEPTNYKPDIMTDEHYAYVMGREDGKIYPQANLTRAEAATIFFRLLKEDVRAEYMTKDNKFTDVESGAWYNTAVSTLANLGLINGRTETTYAPNATITRAELTTIVARLSKAQYNGADLFTDISGHWARSYINIAASINWVNGENGKFRPNDNITRAEVMTLINRVLNRQPETTADLLNGMKVWSDNNPNSWYYIAVQEATNSHDYTMKADGVHESWTRLTEDPDWAAMEK